MITPAYSPTATERVLPRMALDFTTAALDSRVTIARALNTATRVNSSGAIEFVNANLPRFDYTLGSGGACKGLLIEEARTNSLTGVDSVNPTGITGWTTFGDAAGSLSVVSDDAALAAAGLSGLCSTGKVFKLDNSAGTTPFYARVNNSITLGANTWAFSTYARGSGSFSFDVNAGTWTPGGTSPAVTSVYQRLVSIGASSVSSNQYRVRVTGGSVVYFILMQAEQGAFPTSVIPNTGTSITRNADNVSMTGTNFSDWYNASEGAFVTQVSLLNISAGHLLTAFQGYSDVMRVRMLSSIPTANITVGGASQFDSTSQGSLGAITTNEIFSSALAYKQNDTSFAAKGVSVSTDTSVNLVTAPSRLAIGSLDNVGSGSMTGHMRRVFYYPQRLSNAEIAAFSK
jgi:hypothetical protein